MNIDHELRARRLARIRIRAEVARRRSERAFGGRRASAPAPSSARLRSSGKPTT